MTAAKQLPVKLKMFDSVTFGIFAWKMTAAKQFKLKKMLDSH